MLLYMLQYMKWNEGVRFPVRIYYDSLETLLADCDEFALKKGEYKVFEFEGKEMDAATILSRFTEEIENGSQEE